MSESPRSTPPPDLSRLRIQRDAPRVSGGGRRIAAIALIALAILATTVVSLLKLRRPVDVEVASVAVSGGGTVTGEGISANGYVVARTKASVSAKIPGRLASLGVHEGSEVRKGEVMARVESAAYEAAVQSGRAAVARADAELAQAQRDLERARRLQGEQVISAHDLEDAETRATLATASRAVARAQLQSAEVDLENTRVRAPFDGTVLRKDAEVGEIVAPSAAGGGLTRTAIVTMADLRTLEVEVDVNEAYIAQIQNGQQARVTLDAYPDTSFRAEVRQIVPTADRQKATVLVKVSILDRDARILPEMGAKVVFLRNPQQASVTAAPRVWVPERAVRRDGERARVWVVEQGKLASREVVLGNPRGESVEVQRGLSGGETVVLDPQATLREGLKVRTRSSS